MSNFRAWLKSSSAEGWRTWDAYLRWGLPAPRCPVWWPETAPGCPLAWTHPCFRLQCQGRRFSSWKTDQDSSPGRAGVTFVQTAREIITPFRKHLRLPRQQSRRRRWRPGRRACRAGCAPHRCPGSSVWILRWAERRERSSRERTALGRRWTPSLIGGSVYHQKVGEVRRAGWWKLTERNLKPRTEMMPAKKPTIMEPKGVSIISPAVPTATPPARAAFWMWTYSRRSY